jgi:hypothetical protein
MSDEMRTPWQPANPARLAREFSRLGWTGFWIQLVLITLPLLLFIYLVFFAGTDSAQRRGIDLGNYLSYGGLLVMVFTTFWFYRYTRLANRIADPARRPSLAVVMRILWIGLWASCLGILFSILLLLGSVGRLLFALMTMPQTGLPVAAVGGDPVRTVSAIDAASMSSLLLMLSAEFIVLAFTLWLLFRVSRPKAEAKEQIDVNPESANKP